MYEDMFERPLECSGCQLEGCINYIEIEKEQETGYAMCSECPFLQVKLHGEPSPLSHNVREEGLSCIACGTTLQTLKADRKAGCPECYVVFEARIKEMLHPPCFHVGRTIESPSISTRAAELNIELSEALKKENYEHAAYLRDHIKELIHDRPS
jgi:protein arginine kinase activator